MLKNLFQRNKRAPEFDKNDWLTLSIGLLFFIVISLWTITKSSIWFDEAFGAYLAQFDFLKIAQYTALDVHPPLYYWLLKIWGILFGTTELGLRSMSVVLGGVSIFFGYIISRRLFGLNAARLGLLFMVLSPMFVRYSQEMRGYTLMTAIVFAATYVLLRAVETKKQSLWITYGVLVSLGMWTHYFTAVAWLAHWAWRLFVIRSEKKKDWLKNFFSRDWVIAHVVAIVLYLPWLPWMVRQFADTQINGFWIPPVSITTLPNFFTNILFYRDHETVSPWMVLLFLVIIVAIIAFTIHTYQKLNPAEKHSYLLVAAVSFVPMVLLIVLSMPPLRSYFVDRYLVPSSLAIGLFIGITIALSANALQPFWRRTLAVLIAFAMILGVMNVMTLGNYNKTLHTSNNTRQLIEAIETKMNGNEPIIADSPWLFYEAVFYSNERHPVYFIDANTEYRYGSLEMLRTNDMHKIKDLTAFAKEHPIIWYIGRPGNRELSAPDSSWQTVMKVAVDDSIEHRPSYKAVQYKTNAE